MSAATVVHGGGTEYFRRIKFSCPVCLSSQTEEVWVSDLEDLKKLFVPCRVCRSPTLRIDTPEDDVSFFVYRDVRQKLDERIGEQMEDQYDYR